MGVDHFLDMGRTATNVIGNAVASAAVAKWEGVLMEEGAREEAEADDVVQRAEAAATVPAAMQHGHRAA